MSSAAGDKESLHRLGAELLASGMTVRIKVSGFSMYPTMRPDDIVEITPVEPGVPLKPGEIIAIKRETDFIVHRFIGYAEMHGEQMVVARGDSNPRVDSPVPAARVAGKVITIIRGRTIIRNPLAVTNVTHGWNRFFLFFFLDKKEPKNQGFRFFREPLLRSIKRITTRLRLKQ